MFLRQNAFAAQILQSPLQFVGKRLEHTLDGDSGLRGNKHDKGRSEGCQGMGKSIIKGLYDRLLNRLSKGERVTFRTESGPFRLLTAIPGVSAAAIVLSALFITGGRVTSQTPAASPPNQVAGQAGFRSEVIAPGIEHIQITRGYKSE